MSSNVSNPSNNTNTEQQEPDLKRIKLEHSANNSGPAVKTPVASVSIANKPPAASATVLSSNTAAATAPATRLLVPASVPITTSGLKPVSVQAPKAAPIPAPVPAPAPIFAPVLTPGPISIPAPVSTPAAAQTTVPAVAPAVAPASASIPKVVPAPTTNSASKPATTASTPTVTAPTSTANTSANTAKKSHTTGALQQQIQAQLQQQLQAQLQAAAARGQQANITPEQIQAQAQAMVQAAAQAQAVVSAAKSRGDGLVPMNSQQIAALSQIQAQAIVNARPQTALLASGTPTVDKDGKPVQPTQAQIQHQITLQAQALVHAHTQAQIAAGIYKGDANGNNASGGGVPKPAAATTVIAKPATPVAIAGHPASIEVRTVSTAPAVARTTMNTQAANMTTTTVTSSTTNPLLSTLTPAQLAQQNKLVGRQSASKDLMLKNHNNERINLRTQFQQQNIVGGPTLQSQATREAQIKTMDHRQNAELAALQKAFTKELSELHAEFRKQNAAAEYAGLKVSTLPNPTGETAACRINAVGVNSLGVAGINLAGGQKLGTVGVGMNVGVNAVTSTAMTIPSSSIVEDGTTVTSSTSPAFLEKLSGTLNRFWTDQLHQMRDLGTTIPQTEQDFKNHNDLPLARIKRIMKSDEDVRMISAEAPVLFAKACEMFILELTLRSWSYSENNKRRTLQKEDIREAIQRTDIFDFLVDVIH